MGASRLKKIYSAEDSDSDNRIRLKNGIRHFSVDVKISQKKEEKNDKLFSDHRQPKR